MPRNSRYGNHGDYNFKSNDDRGRRYRNAEEPEWFSGGPTSQNDTIELRGFEEYPSERQDSPISHNDEAENDKAATATADYESDTDNKAIDECGGDKSNDDNNNDNDKSGNDDALDYRESDADKNAANTDFDPDDMEVMGTVAESKPNKKDDNFNFEDFLKGDNLTDLLTVSVINAASIQINNKDDNDKLVESIVFVFFCLFAIGRRCIQ